MRTISRSVGVLKYPCPHAFPSISYPSKKPGPTRNRLWNYLPLQQLRKSNTPKKFPAGRLIFHPISVGARKRAVAGHKQILAEYFLFVFKYLALAPHVSAIHCMRVLDQEGENVP
ncbi:hypothetical protein SBA4_2150017 [Candidatus Sulfopaludibacter sp. SbA4]|nr:hypothetical protein SBA4_2150017 [Candidatus Sulfopaludibacter sp. SbA4]